MVKVYEVMRSIDRLLALNVIGCILIVIGIMLIYIPAGVILAGIACLLVAHEREVNNEYSKNDK
jgi:hypothetical protein